jgi:DNA-directed RNA polymerase subunit H (RpoH/RPB5)|tara:strand:+ start:623 stop:1213 length:591 start_codon:yes stop_codon:yes gene_type:complete
VLEQLQTRGYDISSYENTSMTEIDAMLTNSQLDMLVTHKDTGVKMYIKYYFTLKQTSRQIKKEALDDIIDDLYHIEDVLTKKDTLMVIIDDEPNDTIITRLKYLYDHDGIFVVLHNIHRLQFNILNHTLVPKMWILGESEKTDFMQNYKIRNLTQLPQISRFDPQALVLGIRPNDICQINRDSVTAMTTDYFRVCV